MKPPVKNLPQRSDAQPDVRLSRQQTPEPRLPYEHDESADSQGQGAVPVDPVGQRAYDDVQAGRPDTDKPYILLVTGYPADDAQIPQHATEKKPLHEIATFFE